jgi:hypothetical protein
VIDSLQQEASSAIPVDITAIDREPVLVSLQQSEYAVSHQWYNSVRTSAAQKPAAVTGNRTAAHPVMEHYTKGEVLGKGTFGVVVRATHKLVKLLVTSRAGNRGMPAGYLYMEGLPPQPLNVSIEACFFVSCRLARKWRSRRSIWGMCER